jgi:hypothetical protein
MTLAQLFQRWPVLLGGLVLGGLIGLTVAAIQKPRFVANMTIASLGAGETVIPAGMSASGSGVLQALRGITGANPAAMGEGDYVYFVALLSSDRTAQFLLQDQAFLRRLFPSEWDEASGLWRRAPGLLSPLSALYNRVFFGTGYIPPNVPRIKERLATIMSVQFDIENSQHILSVKSQSCATSRAIIQSVFSTADQILKTEKSRRFIENVRYLETQVADQRNAALRSELASALVLQHLRQISSRSRLPLAVRVIDGPGCGPRPTLPQPVPYALLGGAAGLGLSFLGVVLFGSLRLRSDAD